MRQTTTYITLLFLALLTACDTGITDTQSDNIPPNTFLVTDEITRSEEDRFSSQIQINWWADDPDGFVSGYEYTFADTVAFPWAFTTKNDSIFVLPIPQGQQTADVIFQVRAIDNVGARDLTPAQLVYPVKNSAPEVEFNRTDLPPDTTFALYSFGWTITDIDGEANLDHLEIAVNDTVSGWTVLPLETRFMSIDLPNMDSPSVAGDIYFGRSFRNEGFQIDGINIDEENELYIRVFDRAGSVSPIDTARWFQKRQTSRVLMLNDISTNEKESSQQFHLSLLDSAGISTVDILDISDGTAGGGLKANRSRAFPTITEPTLLRLLAKWDFIYWISDDLDRNISYAQEIAVDFFNNGGKMFVTIPTKGISNSDPVLNFLSINALEELPVIAVSFQIANGRPMEPLIDLPGLPILQSTTTITGVYPFTTLPSATPLYSVDFRIRTLLGREDFTGNETIAAKSGDGNVIYFGIDLTLMNGRSNADSLIQALVVDDLGFAQ